MKLHWGKAILFVFIGFVLFVVISVVFYMRQDPNLVEDKYYEKSTKYQDQIDKKNNMNHLTGKVFIVQNNNELTIFFPNDENLKDINAKLSFLRPDNSKKDFNLDFSIPAPKKTYSLPLNGLAKGKWRTKLDFTSNGVNYFFEDTLSIK